MNLVTVASLASSMHGEVLSAAFLMSLPSVVFIEMLAILINHFLNRVAFVNFDISVGWTFGFVLFEVDFAEIDLLAREL